MALTKEVKIDKLEIGGDFKAVQWNYHDHSIVMFFNQIQTLAVNLKRHRTYAMQSGLMKLRQLGQLFKQNKKHYGILNK